jgi:site-specific recombinase XerD
MSERKITTAALAAFESWLKTEERSAGTIENYLRDLRTFAVWLEGREASKALVTEWKEQLQSKYAAVTVNAKLSAINGFFRFMGWDDCRVKFLKVQRKLFRETDRDLDRNEYDCLTKTAQAQGRERLALVMEAICATGIRVSEVKYITVEAARQGRAEISLKGKIRTILLPNKLCRKLLKYAKTQKITSGEIFLTRGGKGLSRKQIWAEMKALCRSAGVAATKVFPHNLRHLFAATFYRCCRDIARLADVLGHSSIETTRVYLISTGAEHQRQLDRLGLVS